MRTAQTVLTVIQERGKQHKPIERVYKLLFNRDFYLNAYAKLYPNNGAMTKGVTDETVDGMSIQKIDRMIELLREENTNGNLQDVNIFRRKTERNVLLVFLHGETSYCKR